MGRHDLDPEDRDQEPFSVGQIVACPECRIEFDVVFVAPEGVFEAEDLVDAIEMTVTCPMGHTFVATYEGWVHHEDAG